MENISVKSASDKGILPSELPRVALAATAFFLILCSYYILRPVRDDMGVRFGADRLHWLFTATFLATLLIVPLFGRLVQRMRRAWILPAAYTFLCANLVAFHAAFAAGADTALAALFFVWLSVFNLFVVSLFWSNVSDAFSAAASHRVYGHIAAGGTAGALAGPALTASVARHVGTAQLLALSALLLGIAALCMILLRRMSGSGWHVTDQTIGGAPLAGIGLTLKSRNLRGIALLVICYTAVSTALYVEMLDLTGKSFPDAGERKSFFALIDLAVNLLALILQLSGTRRLVQNYGVKAALSVVPLLVLAGLFLTSVASGVIAIAILQVLNRAGDYAINRPGREMIYTTVDPESRYKAKNFIDTAVYRANDAASAWLINALRGAGLDALLLVGVPAAAAWLLTGFRIGRRHDEDSRNEPA